MSTVLADPTSPAVTPDADTSPAAPAPPETLAGDRFALFFWLGCASVLIWLLLADMARGLLRP